MLIEFQVANYRSFRDPARLNMAAARPIKEFLEENVFAEGRYRLVKSAAVYGANASGKSNLMDAFVTMRWFVLNSSKETQANESIGVTPFKLDADFETRPSRFEVTFLLAGIAYRYGYEANSQGIESEWLFQAKRIVEKPLFVRRGKLIEVGDSFSEGRGLEDKTRDNALFLSVVAQFNGETAVAILLWFARILPLHGLREDGHLGRSIEMLQEGEGRDRVLDLMRKADFGIEAMSVTEKEVDAGTGEVLRLLTDEGRRRFLKQMAGTKSISVSALHPKYKAGARIGTAALDLASEESAGTQKFFHLIGPLLDCLDQGRVAIMDELDAKLHPNLTCAVVRLFNSKVSNPQNAQLVFCTHDTNLLSSGRLRRDQIWFVEKTREGATDLFSLAELKLPRGSKVRNDAAYEKNYLQGRYGGVPFLRDLAAATREE